MFPSDVMFDYDSHHYEEVLLTVWAAGCLVGGAVFLLVGARAVGLALLGSLAGAFVGVMSVASNIDSLPFGGALGATIGTFVAGSAGLVWKPAASRSFLNALGFVIAVVGAVAVLGIHFAAERTCHHGASCLPRWRSGAWSGTWEQALLAFDVAFLVLICLLQARQARSSRTSAS